MRYFVLATDFDGTLAQDGRVTDAAVSAVQRLSASGRKVILVTGRELPDLENHFPHLELFDWVVAENGALLYNPQSRESKLMADPPPPHFVSWLRELGVAPLLVGQVIVATLHPHESTVLEAIRDLGLEMQVIFNKDAVMVLPSGVNKATGLNAALGEMGFTLHETVGIGDAENDHTFLAICECSAAVANALPAVKERADLVVAGDHGAGVVELIDALIQDDLAGVEAKLRRHHLEIGADANERVVRIAPYNANLLIAGPSGSGKSTAAASFLERLTERHYQFLLIDPEGDYEEFPGTLAVGSAQRGPELDETLQALASATGSVVVNLVGLTLSDRPPFFLSLLPRVLELRARTGRPHWLFIDEAHHLLPASWQPGGLVLPRDLNRTLFITVHPDQVAPSALATIDSVFAVGLNPETTLGQFCVALQEPPPQLPATSLDAGEVLFWARRTGQPPARVRVLPSKAERRRHTRKYAEGELPPERSFYFRGPENKLNLRAQNLILFLQLAEGVDDETWQFHLAQGDYSAWFRDCIKDPKLADEAARVERKVGLDAAESRAEIKSVVQSHYTLPAGGSLAKPDTDAEAMRTALRSPADPSPESATSR